jgi:AmmeMemoRadiSam system protein A
MLETSLSQDEKEQLLDLAYQSVQAAVTSGKPPEVELEGLPPRLSEQQASFVTLRVEGVLRGCIGAIRARLPLAIDVIEHAAAAAQNDPRFSALKADELSNLELEVSVLSHPQPLDYQDPADLLHSLTPDIDGVIIQQGIHRATFLPQVWTKVSGPEEFLNRLCEKARLAPDVWQQERLEVFTYQVECFHR